MSDGSSTPPGIKKKLKVKDDGLWLTSFADLSLQLMCLFALLLSFSTMDKNKFENVKDGIVGEPSTKKSQNKNPTQVENLKQISSKLMKEIKAQKLNAKVSFDIDGVAVEFDDQLFFASGAADLNAQYRPLTDKLLAIIAKSPTKYNLVFEGHTDDVPPGRKLRFASNWELSSARGLSLLNEMARRGVSQERMSVTSYAQTKPKVPITDKKGEQLEAARKANRRVVIRIR
jgi:flagellar motor protein MotB